MTDSKSSLHLNLASIFGVFGYKNLPVDKIIERSLASENLSIEESLKFFGHNITRASSVTYLPTVMLLIGKLENKKFEKVAEIYTRFMWDNFKKHPKAGA